MIDWYLDRDVIMGQMETALMERLVLLLDDTQINDCVNYWIDSTHNMFAQVYGTDEELWVEVKLELYNTKDEYIGDLRIYDTKDMSREALYQTVREIVKDYYME